ncbi:hypothetical protein [Pseudalkalibacillus caeni]|uniref:hypothetical protein n=1 Tax=Exobacillus caeni TaxID=2574798 RepID=UPI001484F9C4|nr:hypothetical protein [Pseudalkalibacillus caeni]
MNTTDYLSKDEIKKIEEIGCKMEKCKSFKEMEAHYQVIMQIIEQAKNNQEKCRVY